MIRMTNRKFYKERIAGALAENRNFLIAKFSKEWDEIQKIEKRKGRLDKFKTGGKIIGRILLGLLAVGGIFVVAIAAPQIFVIFDKRGRRLFLSREDFNKIKWNLKRQKCIEVVQNKDGSFQIFLTKKGEKRAIGEIFGHLSLDKNNKWDKLWRVVIFDIPDRHKWARDGFRRKLKEMDFYQLQESVFITPYPCDDEIDFLVSVFNINSYVHFFTTSNLSIGSQLIKERFSL